MQNILDRPIEIDPTYFTPPIFLDNPGGGLTEKKAKEKWECDFYVIFAVRKKRNDSHFERNQAIFAVRKKRNDSDFKQNQAIFAVRKKRNGINFEQNQQVFSEKNSRET